MKRILRISLDMLITSIVPIASWFLLGMILDGNLINIFTLTYPIQFVMASLKSIFATGANISKYKNKNENATESGMMAGLVIGAVVFGLLVVNINKYIEFMEMDIGTYRTFAIYAILQMFLQYVLQLVLSKLYYNEENSKANKISITFNLISFVTLILMSLITKNQYVIIMVSLGFLFVYTTIILIKNIDKFKFSLNIFNCIKYDSVEFFTGLNFIIIYLFGFSNAFHFGENYVLAISFATLVTDMQWDICHAINTVAKVDISKKKFKYKEHLKNGLILDSMLSLSVIVATILLYKIYNVELNIALVFIGGEILNLLVYPVYIIKICYLQLEQSALKATVNKEVGNILRTAMSFAPTPYCTIIGQMLSMIYQLIFVKISWKKEYNENYEG